MLRQTLSFHPLRLRQAAHCTLARTISAPMAAKPQAQAAQIHVHASTNTHPTEQPANERSDASHDELLTTLSVIPVRHSKVLHLVRHGEGYHNVAGAANEQEYLNPKWLDAHLTPLGWQQAATLRRHIQGLPGFRADLVVVSPLTRTLETAAGVFGGGAIDAADGSASEGGGPAAAAGADGGGAPSLTMIMTPQTEIPGLRAAHPAISAQGCPPFIAYEGCREHFGQHFCDKRRSLHETRPRFPGIDFSLIKEEEDMLWQAGQRETEEEVKRRGVLFMQWLMARPESHIAVVSHGGLLWHTLSSFGRQASTAVQQDLHAWYENCEMRSVLLVDSGGTHQHPDTWRFHGGRRAVEGMLPSAQAGRARRDGLLQLGNAEVQPRLRGRRRCGAVRCPGISLTALELCNVEAVNPVISSLPHPSR